MTSAADQADSAGPDGSGAGGRRQDSSDPDGRPAAASRAARRRRALVEAAVTLLAAVLLAAGIHAFVIQAFYIPTPSMVPTLQVGDRILVLKAFFNWHDLHQGDIVVFSQPPRDRCGGPADGDLVKRVIALPGQTIYSPAVRSTWTAGRWPSPTCRA